MAKKQTAPAQDAAELIADDVTENDSVMGECIAINEVHPTPTVRLSDGFNHFQTPDQPNKGDDSITSHSTSGITFHKKDDRAHR